MNGNQPCPYCGVDHTTAGGKGQVRCPQRDMLAMLDHILKLLQKISKNVEGIS